MRKKNVGQFTCFLFSKLKVLCFKTFTVLFCQKTPAKIFHKYLEYLSWLLAHNMLPPPPPHLFKNPGCAPGCICVRVDLWLLTPVRIIILFPNLMMIVLPHLYTMTNYTYQLFRAKIKIIAISHSWTHMSYYTRCFLLLLLFFIFNNILLHS